MEQVPFRLPVPAGMDVLARRHPVRAQGAPDRSSRQNSRRTASTSSGISPIPLVACPTRCERCRERYDICIKRNAGGLGRVLDELRGDPTGAVQDITLLCTARTNFCAPSGRAGCGAEPTSGSVTNVSCLFRTMRLGNRRGAPPCQAESRLGDRREPEGRLFRRPKGGGRVCRCLHRPRVVGRWWLRVC